MSDNVEKSVTRSALTQVVIAEMLLSNFERLPVIDQKLFSYGHLYLGGNAGLAGLISNSLYRRALNVSHARFSSSLPMVVLPFLTTFTLYQGIVSSPLLSGDLNCPTCCIIRGALVGFVGGGVYPIFLALPLNIGLASRYSTTPMPEKGALFRFGVDLSRPVLKKMRAVFLLQTLFGSYLGSRNFESYVKLAQLTFGRDEDLSD